MKTHQFGMIAGLLCFIVSKTQGYSAGFAACGVIFMAASVLIVVSGREEV